MKITDWAKCLGLEIQITTSSVGWCAGVRNAEVMANGCLGGVVGFGATPDEALSKCADAVSRKRIAVDAYKDSRREYDVPDLRWP